MFVLFSCTSRNDYRVASHLTAQQQDEMMWKIIRYAARAPEGLSFEERFYPGYDTFYQKQTALHRFDAYFIQRNQHYFLISRRAPSLMDKRVAIGGRFTLAADGKLEQYEEVFRTWKMTPDTLAKRSLFLFDKLVKGESLTPYETRNSNGVEYIEFPDERTYFDKETKQWRVK
jgi:hypothetical protein